MSTRLASQPNVTPMIDVMLVLLIVFMVVAPMLASGLHATPPTARNLTAHPEEHVVSLAMSRFGDYSLDARVVPRTELPALLRARFAGRSDHTLFITADRQLDYAKVLDVIDAARANGVTVVGMIALQEGRAP